MFGIKEVITKLLFLAVTEIDIFVYFSLYGVYNNKYIRLNLDELSYIIYYTIYDIVHMLYIPSSSRYYSSCPAPLCSLLSSSPLLPSGPQLR